MMMVERGWTHLISIFAQRVYLVQEVLGKENVKPDFPYGKWAFYMEIEKLLM